MPEDVAIPTMYTNIGKALKLTSGFPFESKHFSNSEGVPLIRIRDLLSGRTETRYNGSFSDEFIVKSGDILVGMDGDFNIIRWTGPDALLNQRVLKVDVSDPTKIDRDYIYYWLQPYLKKINDQTPATTVKHLSVKSLQLAEADIPKFQYQRKIADILKTIDAEIEQTEALIAKYELIKTGMMQDLFTRGLTLDGQLRPPREEAPDLYQNTPIGWIPKDWELKRISDIASDVTSGSRDWSRFYSETGDLFVRIGNLTRRHINLRLNDLQFVDLGKRTEGTRTKLVVGDILISITADLGIIGVVPDWETTAYINQHIALVRCQVELISPRFLGHQLASKLGQDQFTKQNDPGAKAGLNLPAIRSLMLAKPSMTEQASIAERLDAVDEAVRKLEIDLSKLRLQKAGLMQDLLSGKVPVKV